MYALQNISNALTPYNVYVNFINGSIEAAAECIPTEQRANHGVPSEIFTAKKKREDGKIASVSNRKKPINVNP